MRLIMLDTETTGLYPNNGDKMVEIGAVEICNMDLSQTKTFHKFINPCRTIPEEVVRIHGIDNNKVKDAPVFKDIAREFLDFIQGGTLVIHNAPFDLGFILNELPQEYLSEMEEIQVIDSYEVAKSLFPRKRNSLDKLCDRFGIDREHRVLHGALLDADLLANVFLAMTQEIDSPTDLETYTKPAASYVTGLKNQGSETADSEQEVIVGKSRDTELSDKHSFQTIKNLLFEEYRVLQKRYENQREVIGISTGFKNLDGMTAGLQNGELIVIASRPGMGKSSFMLNLAANVSLRDDHPNIVAVFSLVTQAKKLITRLLASESRVDMGKMRVGKFEPDDWRKLASGTGKLSEASIFIDDEGIESIKDIRKKCEVLRGEVGRLDVIMIDDIDLLLNQQSSQLQEEVMQELKAVALKFKVPVLMTMSLPRTVDLRKDNRAKISDLVISDAIERSADLVMFIYRPEVNHPTPENEGVAEMNIVRQKNGPTGKVWLSFFKEYARFECREHLPSDEQSIIEEYFEHKENIAREERVKDVFGEDVFPEKGDGAYD